MSSIVDLFVIKLALLAQAFSSSTIIGTIFTWKELIAIQSSLEERMRMIVLACESNSEDAQQGRMVANETSHAKQGFLYTSQQVQWRERSQRRYNVVATEHNERFRPNDAQHFRSQQSSDRHRDSFIANRPADSTAVMRLVLLPDDGKTDSGKARIIIKNIAFIILGMLIGGVMTRGAISLLASRAPTRRVKSPSNNGGYNAGRDRADNANSGMECVMVPPDCTTLDSITDGVITTDKHGRVTYLNPAAEKLLDYERCAFVGKDLHTGYRIRMYDTHQEILSPFEPCLQNGQVVRHEGVVLMNKNGKEHIIRDTATPMFKEDGGIGGMVLIFNDYRYIASFSEKLLYEATHDALTGLLNRRAFESHLEHLIEAASHVESGRHVVCYIDLDNFKIVNDSCGHAAGDELLKVISNEIRSQIRNHDLLARLGGDEFGVLLQGCPVEKAEEIAGQICDCIRNIDFEWQGNHFRVGASIGVVVLDTAVDNDLTQVLKRADAACYAAKRNGRGRVQVI